MYYYEYNPTPEPEETPSPVSESAFPFRKKRRIWPAVLGLLLACAIVGGGSGVLSAMMTARLTQGSTTLYLGEREPVVVNVSKVNTGEALSLPEIYLSNINSVVGVTVDVTTTNVFGQPVSRAASGSGFVIHSDGYILTNYHVVENARNIKVSFSDGAEYDAKHLGGDADKDIAVLKVEADGLAPVIIGDSDDMRVGEQVTTIGNPLGELTFSQTVGYISALERNITLDHGKVMKLIQTDTAINSGSSGGPLFNIYGEVIGITNAKYSNNTGTGAASIEGIAFAIPINDVIDLVRDIIENGYVTGKPYMGVTVSTALQSEAQKYGRSGGAYVQEVVPGSCAELAGLRVGDIVTKIDDVTVEQHADLIAEKDNHSAGDKVTLTVDRDGTLLTLDLTFDEVTPEVLARIAADEARRQEEEARQQQEEYEQTWPFFGGW